MSRQVLSPWNVGDVAQFLLLPGSPAENWEAVADGDPATGVYRSNVNPSFATYVDVYHFENLSKSGEVDRVIQRITAHRATVPSGLGAVRVRGYAKYLGNVILGTEVALTDGETAEIVEEWLTTPNLQPWDRTAVNGTQFGYQVRVRGNGTTAARWEAYEVQVDVDLIPRRADLVPHVDALTSAAVRALKGDATLAGAGYLGSSSRVIGSLTVPPGVGRPVICVHARRTAGGDEGLGFRADLVLRVADGTDERMTSPDRERISDIARRAMEVLLADGAMVDGNYAFWTVTVAPPAGAGGVLPPGTMEVVLVIRGVRREVLDIGTDEDWGGSGTGGDPGPKDLPA